MATTRARKRCPCGARYTADEWRALRLVGLQEISADQELGVEEALYEMRDCVRCRSTIGLRIRRTRTATGVPRARL